MEDALVPFILGMILGDLKQAAFVKYQGGDLVKYQILTGAQNKEETGASRLSTGDA